MTTSLSNLEIIELKQFLWQFWLSLSFFVFFFIQLFPNWTACSPIYSDLKHRQWKLLILPFYLAFWIFFVEFISYISIHFTEPLLSGNVLEISLAFTSWISKHSPIKGTIDIKSDTWGWMVVSGIPGIKSFFSNLLNSSGIRHFVLWLGCLAGDKPSPSHLSQPSQPSYPTYRRFIIVTLAILVATGVTVIPIILRIPVIESFTWFHLP